MPNNTNKVNKLIKKLEEQKAIYERFIDCMQEYKTLDKNNSTADLPKELITLYYQVISNVHFDFLKKAFVKKYIENESEVETAHLNWEKKGLRKMYKYIHMYDVSKMDIYTIMELHEQLYAYAPNKEFGGHFRNIDVYLPGSGTNLSEWSNIRYEILQLKPYVKDLIDRGIKLNGTDNFEELLKYIEECIVLNCNLIRIHPFFDGNGRCIRGFTNMLFELANIPPIYVLENEKIEYREALRKTDIGKYEDIIKFYYYKICDSIFELTNLDKKDINEISIKKLNI